MFFSFSGEVESKEICGGFKSLCVTLSLSSSFLLVYVVSSPEPLLTRNLMLVESLTSQSL